MNQSLPTAHELTEGLRGSPSIVWAQDRDLKYVWVFNPSMGLTAEEAVGRTDHELLDNASADLLESIKRKAMAERKEQYRRVTLVNKGREEVHEVFVRPVLDSNGQPVGIKGVSMRVPDEDRTLAIEADHRIKNSLMMAQALLRMQSKNSSEDGARSALGRAAGVIGAIAHLHANLAEGGSNGLIHLKDYLETAISVLAEILDYNGAIKIETDIADEVLEGGAALKIALIVAELIMNSAKHAGDVEQPLVIRVSYLGSEGGTCLVVEDNGEGLPYGFDAQGDSGIGMRVVQSLAQALGTSPEIDKKAKGARFVFSFREG